MPPPTLFEAVLASRTQEVPSARSLEPSRSPPPAISAAAACSFGPCRGYRLHWLLQEKRFRAVANARKNPAYQSAPDNGAERPTSGLCSVYIRYMLTRGCGFTLPTKGPHA